MSLHAHITSLFSPRSIAVVGASQSPGKIGNIILANLLHAGYDGVVHPINPSGGSILGLPALRKIGDIPPESRPLDMAVLCLPAEAVPMALEQLAELPVRSAVVISAGFKETGGSGVELEEEVKNLASRHNIALLGPNCLGLVHAAGKVNVTFAAGDPLPGNIGFFSQSGALCVSIFDWARRQNIGFSSFVSLGNKAVVDEADVLAHLADDPETKVIVGYLESVECGPRFLRNAHIATRKKPVILYKAGRTAAGALAASSHTGALAGADMAYEAAFKQTGIIRARLMEDLFDLAKAFAARPLPKGPGVAVVTNAGGPGIIATDACAEAGLTMARLSAQTTRALKEFLPTFASVYNPVDVVGDARAEVVGRAVEVVMQDPAVHSVLVLAAPTARTGVDEIARRVAEVTAGSEKPVFACLMGGDGVEAGRQTFIDAGIPCYDFPEPAVEVIAAMYRQSRWKDNPMPVEVNYRRDRRKAAKIIETARASGTLELVEFQALDLLKAYEMPVLESRLARTSDEAVHAAKQIGLPVALKIASPQISHKTDVGGVVLNLDSPERVRAAFLEITGRAMRLRKGVYVAGCLVQAMATPKAREVIVGFRRDSRFGPMVIFGLGGIHVEAFKDISCRLAPLSLEDVHDMVREIRAFPILAGMRGQGAVKFTALEDILLIMSQLAVDFPEIQEAECNPVLADENGAVVADIRVVLTRECGEAGALPPAE